MSWLFTELVKTTGVSADEEGGGFLSDGLARGAHLVNGNAKWAAGAVSPLSRVDVESQESPAHR